MYSFTSTNGKTAASSIRPHSSLNDLTQYSSVRGKSTNYSPQHPYHHNHHCDHTYLAPRPPLRRYYGHRERLLQSEVNIREHERHVLPAVPRSRSFSTFYRHLGNRSMDQQYPYFSEISEWLRFQPLSILQLDPADRIVLFIAGKFLPFCFFLCPRDTCLA